MPVLSGPPPVIFSRCRLLNWLEQGSAEVLDLIKETPRWFTSGV